MTCYNTSSAYYVFNSSASSQLIARTGRILLLTLPSLQTQRLATIAPLYNERLRVPALTFVAPLQRARIAQARPGKLLPFRLVVPCFPQPHLECRGADAERLGLQYACSAAASLVYYVSPDAGYLHNGVSTADWDKIGKESAGAFELGAAVPTDAVFDASAQCVGRSGRVLGSEGVGCEAAGGTVVGGVRC